VPLGRVNHPETGVFTGGEGGIRTHGAVTDTPDFESDWATPGTVVSTGQKRLLRPELALNCPQCGGRAGAGITA